MNAVRTPTHRPLRMASSTLALLVAFAAYALPAAQPAARKALTVEDYTKWRSISSQEIAGDGKWVAYTLQLTNTVAAEAKPVLHLKNLETNEEIKVEHATGGIFSPDSKWIAYQVDPGAAQRARQGRSGQGGSGGNQTPDANPAPPTAPALDQHPRRHQRSPPLPPATSRNHAAAFDRLRSQAPGARRPRSRRGAPNSGTSRRAPCNPGRTSRRLLSPRPPPTCSSSAGPLKALVPRQDEAVREVPVAAARLEAGADAAGQPKHQPVRAAPTSSSSICGPAVTSSWAASVTSRSIARGRCSRIPSTPPSRTATAYSSSTRAADGRRRSTTTPSSTTVSCGTTEARHSPPSREATSRRCARRTMC